MYTVLKNKKVYSNHNDLLEAKIDAIRVSKKSPESLLEVLDDDGVLVYEPKTTEPTVEEKKSAKDTLIRDLIAKCYASISDFDSAKVTLSSTDVGYDDRTETVLNDIIDDLNAHIGYLTSLLSDYDKIIGADEEKGV